MFIRKTYFFQLEIWQNPPWRAQRQYISTTTGCYFLFYFLLKYFQAEYI